MHLRALRIEDEVEAVRAHAELAADDFEFLFDYAPGDAPGDDFAAYVARVDAFNAGGRFSYGGVPGAFFIAEHDGRIVGRLSLRFELNEDLRRWGGHVGYCVRPSFRRRGHASSILRLGLERMKARGVDPVLVTCDEGNVASQRVIERVGGRFLGSCPGPATARKRHYVFGEGELAGGPELG